MFNNYYRDISSAHETVCLTYKSQLNDGDYATLLKESLIKDRISHHTSVGIHKDDIVLK